MGVMRILQKNLRTSSFPKDLPNETTSGQIFFDWHSL